MLRRAVTSCLLAAVAAVSPPAAAAGSGATVMRVNGVTLGVEQRVFLGEPAVLAARLDGRWGQRLTGPTARAPGAPRHWLGRQRGPFHETLTLLPGPQPRTTLALVSVHDLRRPPAVPAAPPVVLPPGIRLLNVVEFGATRGGAAAFTLDSAAPAPGAVRALVASAVAAGWAFAPSPGGAARGRAYWARRAGAELAIVAVRSGSRTRVSLLVTPSRLEHAP